MLLWAPYQWKPRGKPCTQHNSHNRKNVLMTHGPNTPSIPCASIINSQTQKPKQKRKRGKGQGGGWGGTHIQNIQWEFLKPKTSVTLRPNYQYYTLAQHLRARLSKANLGNSLGPTSPPKLLSSCTWPLILALKKQKTAIYSQLAKATWWNQFSIKNKPTKKIQG